MENILTIVKTQIGIFAGTLDKVFVKVKTENQIYLNNPVAFEIMLLPTEGAIRGSVIFNPQWICYKLHTSKIEITLSGPYFIYEISLDEDNFIGGIYKRVMSQEKKSPLSKLH